jgi:hypothetical protein
MSNQLALGLVAASLVAVGLPAGFAAAQTIDPYYVAEYSYTDLGTIPDVPSQYGGLCTLADDPNTLLIGGSANTVSGGVSVVRGRRLATAGTRGGTAERNRPPRAG